MEKLPTYKFCSKEFYHYVKKLDRAGHSKEFDIIYNKFCNGYCKKACELLGDKIDDIDWAEECLHRFLHSEYFRTNHHRKLYNVLGIVGLDGILMWTSSLSRYISLFKRLVKRIDYVSYLIYDSDNKMLTDELPVLWLNIIYECSSRYNYTGPEYIDGLIYINGNYVSDKEIISLSQRRDIKNNISRRGIIQTENIINMIHYILKLFTTKNMTKLTCYYI